jgi:protein gp37
MQKTKIEWCDSTWNPVTGCLHGCEYCYARGIAKRFEGAWDGCGNQKLGYPYSAHEPPIEVTGNEYGGLGPKYCVGSDKNGGRKLINAPYPYGFHPTLHRHRLESGTSRWKKPRTVFVGSMCDMFGNWVPDEWIKAVFEACAVAPQHQYLFLTKNPERYIALALKEKLPRDMNYWYGTTITNSAEIHRFRNLPVSWNTFISFEPIRGKIPTSFTEESGYEPDPYITWEMFEHVNWAIFGAMTGPGAKKHQPSREWIDDICAQADELEIPVFMKESLLPLMSEENMRRELPWEVHT